MAQDLLTLSQTLGELLAEQQQRLVVAESCTGGLLAQLVTAVAGSSLWFDRGYVTYSNEAKTDLLDVSAQIIQQQGAVSEACALAMAMGALAHSDAHWSISITGVAGPTGGTIDKPIGTVWFGLANERGMQQTLLANFTGNRRMVREQAAAYALRLLIDRLSS